MSFERFLLVSAACLALLVPLHAQGHNEWSYFNFNVGGGAGTPLNPTGGYAGIGPNFVIGAGYNFTPHHSVVGQYMWNDLPPNRRVLIPLSARSATMGLFATTANYKYHIDWERAGVYVIGGVGWYYRRASIKQYTVSAATPCQPIYSWWGFACANGFVPTDQIQAYRGVNSIGGNGGLGITVNLGDSGFTYYMEARYDYAPTTGVTPQLSGDVRIGLVRLLFGNTAMEGGDGIKG